MFVVIMLLSVLFWGSVLFLGLRAVRAFERRTRGGGDLGPMSDRLARLEAAVAALATDVQRIEESQEFTTHLLGDGKVKRPGTTTDRADAVPPEPKDPAA